MSEMSHENLAGGVGGSELAEVPPTHVLHVALLMAAHNRRDLTVGTLQTVIRTAPAHWRIRLYLADDGSTDGTSEAVADLPIDQRIIRGPGDWFWSRSMAQAEAAIEKPYDVVLWMNDDLRLDDHALTTLDTYHRRFPENLLVGQFRIPGTEEMSYGGRRLSSAWYPLTNAHVTALHDPIEVDLIAGNLLLVPAAAAAATGPIDGSFSHGYGDYDYGLRARAAGFSALAIPGFLGTTRPNAMVRARSLRESIAFHSSRFGFPLRDRARYLRRHGGRAWPLHVLVPYAAALLGHRPLIRVPNPGSSEALNRQRHTEWPTN